MSINPINIPNFNIFIPNIPNYCFQIKYLRFKYFFIIFSKYQLIKKGLIKMRIERLNYLKSGLFIYLVCSEDSIYSVCLFNEEVEDSYKFHAIESVLIEDVKINCLWQSKWYRQIESITIEIPFEFINLEPFIFDNYIYTKIPNEIFEQYKVTLNWNVINSFMTNKNKYMNKTQDEYKIINGAQKNAFFVDENFTYLFPSLNAQTLILKY